AKSGGAFISRMIEGLGGGGAPPPAAEAEQAELAEPAPPAFPADVRTRAEKLVAALHVVTTPDDALLAEAVALLSQLAKLVAVHERSGVTRLRNELDAMRAVTSRDADAVRALATRVVELLRRLVGIAEPPRGAAFWKR